MSDALGDDATKEEVAEYLRHHQALPPNLVRPGVVCEKCGSPDVNFDGWDIDKCNACGHWRYRGGVPTVRPREEASDA